MKQTKIFKSVLAPTMAVLSCFNTTANAEIVNACQQQSPVGNSEILEGVAVCLKDISNNNQAQMHFYVPDDKVGSTLEITLSHGSGNGNLLHRHDHRPTRTVYDAISDNFGNEERILVQNVQRSWNYIHVRADTDFLNTTLLARYVSTDADNSNHIPENSELIINPLDNVWGGAHPDDVKEVVLSAGSVLLEDIPGVSLDPIILGNIPGNKPVILFRRGSNNEYFINVGIDGEHRPWAQLAYQFSHELMHALSNYGETKNDANQWFEEALSEAASMHALKKMSIVWQTNPPYPHWQSYSSALEDYFNDLINEEVRYLQPGDNIANWYQREKESLRDDEGQRDKNEVIANEIYLFFAESPDRWSSVKYLNIGNANNQISLEQYLNDWKNNSPDDLKYVAETISSWFGF